MSTPHGDPTDGATTWIPDPANIDGDHEDYLARFGDTDLILSLRRGAAGDGTTTTGPCANLGATTSTPSATANQA